MKPSELLSSPDKWNKGCLSMNSRKTNTLPWDQDACSWCIMGALFVCYPLDKDRLPVEETLDKIIRDKTGLPNVVCWQDKPERTFEEVRQLLIDNGY